MNRHENNAIVVDASKRQEVLVKVSSLILFLTMLAVPSRATAQKLQHVAKFATVSGDVQFLPGGYVVKEEDGNIEHYIYRGSKFEPFRGEIPSMLAGWTAFGGGWDFGDQVDRRIGEDVRGYLPKKAKVKKELYVPLDGGDARLTLVCYTLQRIKGADPDIFITGLLDPTLNYNHSPRYQKLWTLKAKSEYYFGDLQYQVVGDRALVLLYSAGAEDKWMEIELNVYRLNDDNQPHALSKVEKVLRK